MPRRRACDPVRLPPRLRRGPVEWWRRSPRHSLGAVMDHALMIIATAVAMILVQKADAFEDLLRPAADRLRVGAQSLAPPALDVSPITVPDAAVGVATNGRVLE